ncbi:transcriptional regulator NarL [Escherichia coli]|uniref:Transcriptional regulator NarL n=1 Tax=Escherichia coli TaxID=562 RepID=A0A2X3JVW5_ECOLX|nr:transcriptional regulator NarL [Escherichia coli]
MSNQEPATILLIDDHPMLRTGVKQLISMAPDITVVGEASNGEQGIELAESLDPDLILLDLNMPGMNGLETLDKLREKSLSGRIVVFSVSNHEEDVVTALKRGADGYLLKRYGTGRSAESIASGSCWRNGIKRSINACSGRQLAR